MAIFKPSTYTIRYWESDRDADRNIYYGFNEDWMIDKLSQSVHSLDDALAMIHQHQHDEGDDSIFDTLQEYDLDADQI